MAAPGPVQADELSRAQQQQKDLARRIADQKALIARLNSSQAVARRPDLRDQGRARGDHRGPAATRKRVTRMIDAIERGQGGVPGRSSTSSATSTSSWATSRPRRPRRRRSSAQRKAELANRIRDAYEAERTSMLETFLSGASFTDMLAEMSTQLDVAEQDKALAAADRRGPRDAARAPRDGRGRPGARPTRCARRPRSRSRSSTSGSTSSRRRRRGSRSSRRPRRRRSPRRSAATSSSPPTRRPCQRRSSRPRRRKRKLAKRIDRLVAQPVQHGQHPVQVQRDAAAGRCRASVSGQFGCIGVRPATRRATAATTSTTASTSSRRTARRSAPRRRAASCTSAGTTPTAPTRPGS